MFSLSRRTGLSLLPSSSEDVASSKSKHTNRRISLTAIFIGLSVVLNTYFVYHLLFKPPNPLDNFQQLHPQNIINHEALVSARPVNPQDNAIVTTLYSDAFATAVATLGHTLNLVNTSARRIVLYLPDRISERALCIATASGFEAVPISRIPPPHNGVHRHFLDQFSKLRLWTLDELGIRSLVYLDADTLVRHNFDELFGLPYNFAAVPDVFLDSRGFSVQFNAGMMFLRPSTAVFEQMIATIATAEYPPSDAEQAFLNYFYGPDAVRLPYVYNANLAIKARSRKLWSALHDEARVVHYTLVKPFLQGDYDEVPMKNLEKNALKKAGVRGGLLREEVLEWVEAWRATKKRYSTTIGQCGK